MAELRLGTLALDHVGGFAGAETSCRRSPRSPRTRIPDSGRGKEAILTSPLIGGDDMGFAEIAARAARFLKAELKRVPRKLNLAGLFCEVYYFLM